MDPLSVEIGSTLKKILTPARACDKGLALGPFALRMYVRAILINLFAHNQNSLCANKPQHPWKSMIIYGVLVPRNVGNWRTKMQAFLGPQICFTWVSLLNGAQGLRNQGLGHPSFLAQRGTVRV